MSSKNRATNFPSPADTFLARANSSRIFSSVWPYHMERWTPGFTFKNLAASLGRPFEHRPALMEVRENPYGARARYVQAKGQEHTHLVVQKDLSAAAQGGRAQSRTDSHDQAAAARYNQRPVFGSRDQADEGRGVPGRLAKLVDAFLAGLFLCFPTGLVVVLTQHVSREEGHRRLGIFLDQHLNRGLLLLPRQFIG